MSAQMHTPLLLKLNEEKLTETISIRIGEQMMNEIERLSQQTQRTRNNIINILLRYGVEHAEIEQP